MNDIHTPNDRTAFQTLESEVRSYCRGFPVVFTTSEGATLTDEAGQQYLDFFGGAGALNYGHNHPELRTALVDYLTSGAITHALDMHTVAKRTFLQTFDEVILRPRGMTYKVAFPSPSGTNAVETALKAARKATGRRGVISFTNGYHGMTLGALAITGNQGKREGGGISLPDTQVMPFDGYLGEDVDTIDVLRTFLEDTSSGVDVPAAIILETIQAEGGVRVADFGWLRKLRTLCDDHGIVLIFDDIQVGCGRTGPFFSFEGSGVQPDIITLSKSLSAYGLPFAVTLIKPEFDVFSPGEHNGTFRGFNPAMVTATAALERFWRSDAFAQETTRKAALVTERLEQLARRHGGEVRGRGFIQAVEFDNPKAAEGIAAEAFKHHLIIETAGARGEVLKFLAPLVVTDAQIAQGFDILDAAAERVFDRLPSHASSTHTEVNA